MIPWLLAAAFAADPDPSYFDLIGERDPFSPWEVESTREELPPIPLGGELAAVVVLARAVVVAAEEPGEVLDLESVAPGEEVGFVVHDGQVDLVAGARDQRQFKNINVSSAVHVLLRRAVEVRVTAVELADVRLVAGDRAWSWADREQARSAAPSAPRDLDAAVAEALSAHGIPASALAGIGRPATIELPGGLALARPSEVLSFEVARAPTERTLLDFVVSETSALDWYSSGLQYEAIRAKEAERKALEQDVRLRELAVEVLAADDPRAARRFERVARALRESAPAQPEP